jgi:predicted metalloprotease with PDZ domain
MSRVFGLLLTFASLCALGSLPARAGEPNAGAVSFATAAHPMTLVLDARDAARGLMFAHLEIPARPGPFTLVYPKWIPGEHGPTGPLNDLAALHISANGRTLSWERDLLDMYAFHIDVPPGAATLDVDFDVLLNAPPDDVMASNHTAVVNWNRDLLYQQDTNSAEVFVRPSIILPDGWDFGTALPVARRSGTRVDFAEVTLRTLVDSPLDLGRYAKHIRLWSNGQSVTILDVFADDPESLDLSAKQINPYRRLVPEALAMYGARHWNNYHALLTLSDVIPGQGIEHHESSDNRAESDFFSNDQKLLQEADLIPHEFSHSWNGKYRRPADLTTANFQIPMKTDLLWVYEGLNQYLGDVLSFRSGLRAAKAYPDLVAGLYATLDTEPGRAEDPLVDTATAAPYLYEARGDYFSLRRSAGDFYSEGELLWLDVDTIIRQRSGGRKSLDDFLHAYAGPPNTGPMVVPYTREDIERLLNGVTPYDWHGFFQRHVYEVALHPPQNEFARAGWRFAYTSEPNIFESHSENHYSGLWFSLGMDLSNEGRVGDVREAGPAWNAGIAPGMKIIAVNGRALTPEVLTAAIKSAQSSSAPIALLVNDEDWFRTYALDYHGGLRYPHLVRIAGRPDMLAKIVAPHAK